MLNENMADWTKRADNPLKNIFNFSSAHSSRNARFNESKRCTYRNKEEEETLVIIDYELIDDYVSMWKIPEVGLELYLMDL